MTFRSVIPIVFAKTHCFRMDVHLSILKRKNRLQTAYEKHLVNNLIKPYNKPTTRFLVRSDRRAETWFFVIARHDEVHLTRYEDRTRPTRLPEIVTHTRTVKSVDQA